MNITQQELSTAIHVPYQRVNELINGKRGLTPSTALRLARFFGMSADFWQNLQQRWDLFKRKIVVNEVLHRRQSFAQTEQRH